MPKKKILITGGTGSFGSNFIKKIMKSPDYEKIIIFSRDEFKQSSLDAELKNTKKLRFFIGDIRDKERLSIAMEKVDEVVHAAALKQVPAAEYNPFEFVKTNILGTENVVKAAIEKNVSKILLLSTDKSVNPANLYGATKLCSEKIFISGNYYSSNNSKFSVVRYGNVINSRGSVIPLFKKLICEGAKELPITDKNMTRFFITFDEAITLVNECLDIMNGGEIFIPKLPSLKIIDLVNFIAPGMKTKTIGIRPGEKLHEKLVTKDESKEAYQYKKIFILMPNLKFQNFKLSKKIEKKVKKIINPFEYSSEKNDEWIDENSFKKIKF